MKNWKSPRGQHGFCCACLCFEFQPFSWEFSTQLTNPESKCYISLGIGKLIGKNKQQFSCNELQ